MIGLNVAARSLSGEPFRNFHDPRPLANDFKIRFAFMGTDFWGAYMTDLIKDFPETVSGRLLKYLKAHPEIVPRHVDALRAELADLGTRNQSSWRSGTHPTRYSRRSSGATSTRFSFPSLTTAIESQRGTTGRLFISR